VSHEPAGTAFTIVEMTHPVRYHPYIAKGLNVMSYECLNRVPASPLLAATVIGFTLALCGCQSQPVGEADAPQQATASPVTAPAQNVGRRVVRQDLAPPPGILVSAVQRDEAGDEAQLTLEQITAELAAPEYLKKPVAEPPVQTEPQLLTQKHYIAARLAMRERDSAEAARQLRSAHLLEPDRPEVLQALAELYERVGNKVRAAGYLKQAVEADPTDTQSLFGLARFALERGQSDLAIVLFDHVQKSTSPTDPDTRGIHLLSQYFLGSALQRAGYDRAAVDQLTAFQDESENVNRNTPGAQQLGFLQRQRGQTWQTIGDTYMRLGKVGSALDAYIQARTDGATQPQSLFARTLYARLKLGDDRRAEAMLLTRLSDTFGRDELLPLVRYLGEAGVSTGRMIQPLRELYIAQGRPTNLALAIAALLPQDDAAVLLIEHMSEQADASEAFAALLATQLQQPATDRSIAQALTLTARAIDASPDQATELAKRLRLAVGDDARLMDAVEKAAAKHTQHPATQFLLATMLIRMGQLDEAAAPLDIALEPGRRADDAKTSPPSQTSPAIPAARIARARLALLNRDTDAALALLNDAPEPDDVEVVKLKVRVLSASDRSKQAIALLDDLVKRLPDNLELATARGELLLSLGEVHKGQRALLDVLNADPTREPVYEILFQLYDSPRAPDDAVQAYQRLMRRMLGTIPDSRIARIKRAELFAIQRNFDAAEKLLTQLLEENRDDWPVLGAYLDMLAQAQRRDEADELIDQRLQADPRSRPLLTLAQGYFQRTGNIERLIEIAERLILLEPDTLARTERLAVLYYQTERPARVVTIVDDQLASLQDDQDPGMLLSLQWRALADLRRDEEIEPRVKQAVDRFEEHEADLLFNWAMVLDRKGDQQRSEAILADIVERFPRHAMSHNGLGYALANRGENLEQAERMIRVAVAVDPDSAAYLDSLGWVLYKQGNFEDAITWLERSRAADGGEYPVIVDHLGDAYYRAGQTAKANDAWRDAVQLLRTTNNRDDRELAGLMDRLREKLRALSANRPAPVADLPGEARPPAAEAD